jgi:hypothetical protein
MTDIGRNMYCAYASDAEDILKFKTFKSSKRQVACKMDNN